MQRIFLVGYMGVGKTTVGKQLSKKLSVDFIDLDQFIQNTHRKNIADIFQGLGEEGFRKIEHVALTEVASFENVVVSTGGGTPCFFDNMQLMNNTGVTIYIQAEPEELAARLLASKNVRPLVAGKPMQELIPFITHHLEERERYYRKADVVIKTSKLISKEHVHITVEKIAEKLKNREINDL